MEELPTSKRDRRRYNMASRLRQLDETYEAERDVRYSDTLHSLQAALYALHQGTHPEFLERLGDLEEERDNRLTELYLWEKYQSEQAEEQYQEEMDSATGEYDHMLQLVKDKLRTRLENQRKRLSDDKGLLDVSNDHSFFLSAGSVNAGASLRNERALLSGNDRRSLRRTAPAEDASGLSGGEGRTRRGRAAASQYSDAETGTDRDLDSVLKDFDHPRSRHITKSYQGVKTLRHEDGLQDIALIRDAAKRIKWVRST